MPTAARDLYRPESLSFAAFHPELGCRLTTDGSPLTVGQALNIIEVLTGFVRHSIRGDTVMTVPNPPPRGIRNNNPGNIDRNTTRWDGMAADQSDPRFVVFDSPEYGIRALAKVLLSYQRKHGLDTVSKIINRWAPPSENDTGAYAAHVAARVGVGPDDRVSLEDEAVLTALAVSIIAHENANFGYQDHIVQAGISLALGKTVEV